MARGLVLSAHTRTTSTFLVSGGSYSIARLSLSRSLSKYKIPILSFPCLSSTRLFCNCSQAHVKVEHSVDMVHYKEAFSRRMAMAGLKPHHRIALGVSGGPDSMALCVLAAEWKLGSPNVDCESGGFIDGLLAIIVDHGLREESKEEAHIVSRRISDMGIKSEIVRCDWLDGRPKQGHLQEAARDMRYQIFHNVCIQHQIGVLFTAHHADDQVELFVLRLSRNSGLLGLAGMPFTSQLFSSHKLAYNEDLPNYTILLMRPLLEFSKEHLYKICQGGKCEWVEDPTNRSPLFARNRIRMSLGKFSTCTKSELQAVISACRKARSYIDHICANLINQTVTIMDKGYAVIDLEILKPSNIKDICLSKFLAVVLQFISQRQRPVRGSTSKLLLDYIRTFPCKASVTAAGCYLCPAPGSKGTKALVCCSVDSPLPMIMELPHSHYNEAARGLAPHLDDIMATLKWYSNHLVPDPSEVNLLDTTYNSVLTEAKRLGIISESTYRNILLLQREEIEHFKLNREVKFKQQSTHGVVSLGTSSSFTLQPGCICNFMNRFIVTWKLRGENAIKTYAEECRNGHCRSCVVSEEKVAEVRHMVESDWLYLAKLSKGLAMQNFQKGCGLLENEAKKNEEKTISCINYARVSAQQSLVYLKSIHVAARRSLPVLVSKHDQILSIPSINFNRCPCLIASAVFKPQVPLGGGHKSFI